MQPALLDTDILNEVLKQKNATVIKRAAGYLSGQQQFAISAITWYEVMRGLREKGATKQLKKFEQFCGHSIIFVVSHEILDRSANLWVEARKGGHPDKDADLIIAATAMEHGRVLVTGNTDHFSINRSDPPTDSGQPRIVAHRKCAQASNKLTTVSSTSTDCWYRQGGLLGSSENYAPTD